MQKFLSISLLIKAGIHFQTHFNRYWWITKWLFCWEIFDVILFDLEAHVSPTEITNFNMVGLQRLCYMSIGLLE